MASTKKGIGTLIGAAAMAMMAAAGAGAETVKLTIIGIGDIYEYDGDGTRGGFARLNAVVKAERAANPNTLYLFDGDMLSPSLISGFDKGQNTIDLTALAPFDLAVPGNHDLPRINLVERFTAPFDRYRRLIGPDLCPLWRHAEAVVVGVNTARSFGAHWNWAHGRISREQVRHVADVMAAATPRQTRIVVAHQRPPQANWVETAGHRNGTLCWRWIGADRHPPVNARVVKFSDL